MYEISVIIPVYNAESTLKKAIESILSQSWEGNFIEEIEIILVDDNSTDHSLDIIKEYVSTYKNIKYCSFSDNSGFGGRGRNKGIEIANAKYIILMDNDDIYLENAFKTLYNHITKENTDIVFANYRTDAFNNKRVYCPKKYDKNHIINPTKSQKTFDLISTTCSMAPWAKIYKKQFIEMNNIKFLENTQFDDADFFIKCLLFSKKISILPKDYVYMYFTYETSQVRLHDKLHFDARLDTIKKMNLLIKEQGLCSDSFITYCLMESLLIVTNSKESKRNKFEMFEDLYEFEKEFGTVVFPKIELKLLNHAILSKNYNLAFFITIIYSFFYNNKLIRQFYRSWNNKNKKGIMH